MADTDVMPTARTRRMKPIAVAIVVVTAARR